MSINARQRYLRTSSEAAARFYAETLPDSAVGAVHRAPSDYPSGKHGDGLTVEFTVAGIPCLRLNGGPALSPAAASASVSTRGVICQETPHLSLHQPHTLSWPLLPAMAFQ
jgi:predicted 3-demethylubiquinone-9 3-methyltransferase (glyoxalase superfamily)